NFMTYRIVLVLLSVVGVSVGLALIFLVVVFGGSSVVGAQGIEPPPSPGDSHLRRVDITGISCDESISGSYEPAGDAWRLIVDARPGGAWRGDCGVQLSEAPQYGLVMLVHDASY